MLLDIHTHHIPTVLGESICCVEPSQFMPVEGCYYAVGIHPWKTVETSVVDWEALGMAVSHPLVLAVGEAGLDKLASADIDMQKDVFVRQILLSESVCKPLVIHCVKAFNELVELKKKYRPQMPWVVHGFRNNERIAGWLAENGIWLSFGEKYQNEVLRSIPPERLLAETDESPCNIREIIGRMATVCEVGEEQMCRWLDENARSIFFRL